MRYGDWDVLLFPTESRAPIKEFKVGCHVVHDPDFTQAQGSFGLPSVCCFIPSQDAGTSFQVSVHSWVPPSISQVTRAYSNHTEDVKFEARLFVDGRLTASTYFERKSIWPYVIANSFHFSKNGDLEPLRFPNFRQELLHQNYWAAGDDIGRIKIIISEGFPRDSASMPFERVKNLVAFSFQHAPLDVLESSGIAWPNQFMWQRHAYTSPMPVPTYASTDINTHAHSPRRHTESEFNPSLFAMPTSRLSIVSESQELSAQGVCDRADYSFAPQSRQLHSIDETTDWMTDVDQSGRMQQNFQTTKQAARKARLSSTDESMPDYPARLEEEFMKPPAPRQSEEESLFQNPKTSFNTLVNGMNVSNVSGCDDSSFSIFHPNMSIPVDLANSLTSSLLSQPLPCELQTHASYLPATEIKSRKEARLQQGQPRLSPSNASTASNPAFEKACEHQDLRKVSQQVYISSGASLPTTIAPLQTLNRQPVKPRNALETDERTQSTGTLEASIASLTGVDPVLRAVSGNSVGKGGQRSLDFTPASPKATDEKDQSHQPPISSPRVRLTPFIEDADDSP